MLEGAFIGRMPLFLPCIVFMLGYRMRIGAGSDSADTGRLHVDYATARDDQYEYECKQRRLAREMRHQQVLESQRMRPPTPPPSVIHFSEHEAGQLNDQLKGESCILSLLFLPSFLPVSFYLTSTFPSLPNYIPSVSSILTPSLPSFFAFPFYFALIPTLATL